MTHYVEPDKKKLRKFGIFGFFWFLALALLTMWRGHEVWFYIFSALSAFFLTATFLAPPVMKVVFRGMMAFAGVIGWLNRQILLSLVYFLLFTSLSLLLRLLGRDFMQRKFDPRAASYWTPREEKPFDPQSYENRF